MTSKSQELTDRLNVRSTGSHDNENSVVVEELGAVAGRCMILFPNVFRALFTAASVSIA